MSEVSEVADADLDQFPSEVIRDVEGLAYLGHLEDTFEFCGHTFSIRTLKADEELAAAILVKEYIDTIGQPKAWAWAHISQALVAVDHDPDFCPPIGPDKVAYARARWNYCTSKWYWPVGEYIFARYIALVQRQNDAIKALQDLSQRSLRTSTAFADSSTDKATSAEA